MRFNDLTLTEKLAMLNLTATLVNLKVVHIKPEQFDEEEIVDALVEQARYLLNKSALL